MIDALLEDDDFARHQARYWRDVIQSRTTDPRGFLAYPRTLSLEQWLYEQFRARRSWAEIAHDLLTAEGEFKLSDPIIGGAIGFLMCHTSDTEIARANDTARVFLGMNIQCAPVSRCAGPRLEAAAVPRDGGLLRPFIAQDQRERQEQSITSPPRWSRRARASTSRPTLTTPRSQRPPIPGFSSPGKRPRPVPATRSAARRLPTA